jgi:nicotinamidase-related amidase
LVFTGIDTSICVETSLREGFTLGYDVAMISDATGSGDRRHYERIQLKDELSYYAITYTKNKKCKSIHMNTQLYFHIKVSPRYSLDPHSCN